MGKINNKQIIGHIDLNNRVRISDPCYGKDVWCAGTLENVKPGRYAVYIQHHISDRGGKRVAYLGVINTEEDLNDYLEGLEYPSEQADFVAGVDSAQCGIYDYEYFVKNTDDEEWLENICKATIHENVFIDDAEYGCCAVSSSGYGDGSYRCYYNLNEDGQIVAIELDYGLAE